MAGYEKSLRLDYHVKELVVSSLWESTMKEDFPHVLNDKLRSILAHWDYQHYVKINEKCLITDDYAPLDIELSPPILTPDEKKTVQLEVEKSIIKNYPPLLKELDRITESEFVKIAVDSKRVSELSGQQKKVVELCTKYYEHLQEIQSIAVGMCKSMREILDLRLGISAKKFTKQAEICSLRTKIAELEAGILCVQLKRFVYGSKSSVQDYVDYYKNMNQTLKGYKKQVHEYKKSLKIDDE